MKVELDPIRVFSNLEKLQQCKQLMERNRRRKCQIHDKETTMFLSGHDLCEDCNLYHVGNGINPMGELYANMKLTAGEIKAVIRRVNDRVDRLENSVKSSAKTEKQFKELVGQFNNDDDVVAIMQSVIKAAKDSILAAVTIKKKLESFIKIANESRDVAHRNKLLMNMDTLEVFNETIKFVVEYHPDSIEIIETVESIPIEDFALDNTICRVLHSQVFNNTQLIGVHTPAGLAKVIEFDRTETTKLDNYGLIWLKDNARYYKIDVYLAYNEQFKVNARISIISLIAQRATVYWIDYGTVTEIDTTQIQIPIQPSIVRYTPPVLTWVTLDDDEDLSVVENLFVEFHETSTLPSEQVNNWNQQFRDKFKIDIIAIGEVIYVKKMKEISTQIPNMHPVEPPKFSLDCEFIYTGKVRLHLQADNYDLSCLRVDFESSSRRLKRGRTKLEQALSKYVEKFTNVTVRTGFMNVVGMLDYWPKTVTTLINKEFTGRWLKCTELKKDDPNDDYFTVTIPELENQLDEHNMLYVDADYSESENEDSDDTGKSLPEVETQEEVAEELTLNLNTLLNSSRQKVFNPRQITDTFFPLLVVKSEATNGIATLNLMPPFSADFMSKILGLLNQYEDHIMANHAYTDGAIALAKRKDGFVLVKKSNNQLNESFSCTDSRYLLIEELIIEELDQQNDKIKFTEPVNFVRGAMCNLFPLLGQVIFTARLSEDLQEQFTVESVRQLMKAFVTDSEADVEFQFKSGQTLVIEDMRSNGVYIRDHIRTKKLAKLTFPSFELVPPNRILFTAENFNESVPCEPTLYQLITTQPDKLANDDIHFTLTETKGEMAVFVHTTDGSVQSLKKFMMPTRRRHSKRGIAMHG